MQVAEAMIMNPLMSREPGDGSERRLYGNNGSEDGSIEK